MKSRLIFSVLNQYKKKGAIYAGRCLIAVENCAPFVSFNRRSTFSSLVENDPPRRCFHPSVIHFVRKRMLSMVKTHSRLFPTPSPLSSGGGYDGGQSSSAARHGHGMLPKNAPPPITSYSRQPLNSEHLPDDGDSDPLSRAHQPFFLLPTVRSS